MMPTPVRKETDLAVATISQGQCAMDSCCAREPLTSSISSAVDVQKIVRHATSKITARQSIKGVVVKLGYVSNDHGRSEKANVLEAVLLSALSAYDCSFCGYEGRVSFQMTS